jgi:hypothetical protein
MQIICGERDGSLDEMGRELIETEDRQIDFEAISLTCVSVKLVRFLIAAVSMGKALSVEEMTRRRPIY